MDQLRSVMKGPTHDRPLPPPGKILGTYSRLYPDAREQVGAALRQALSAHEPTESTGTHASPRPHFRRARWHSFWLGKRDQHDARSVTLKWLPPIPVNVPGVDELTATVRDVGDR